MRKLLISVIWIIVKVAVLSIVLCKCHDQVGTGDFVLDGDLLGKIVYIYTGWSLLCKLDLAEKQNEVCVEQKNDILQSLTGKMFVSLFKV